MALLTFSNRQLDQSVIKMLQMLGNSPPDILNTGLLLVDVVCVGYIAQLSLVSICLLTIPLLRQGSNHVQQYKSSKKCLQLEKLKKCSYNPIS